MSDKDYTIVSLGSFETINSDKSDEERLVLSAKSQPDRVFTQDTSLEEVIAYVRIKTIGLQKREFSEAGHLTGAPKRPYSKVELDILREHFHPEYRWTDISTDGFILLIDKDEKRNFGKFYVTEDDLKEMVRLRTKK